VLALPTLLLVAGAALIGVVFAIASVLDVRVREAPDLLWQVVAGGGVLLGILALAPDGPLALGLWVLVGAFALEHLLPWDDLLGDGGDALANGIEIAVYVGVGAALAWAGLTHGVGAAGLPVPVVAAFLSVLIGRGLFEAGLLYGGADAKAFLAAGIALPLQGAALVALPAGAAVALSVFPFPITMLMNAALLSLFVPIALGVHNLRRGEFSWGRGFTSYTLPVAQLPERFVWIKDPALPAREEAETSEEDLEQRRRARDELTARGIDRVWVSPQLPFLVFLFAGALLAFLAGNLLLDLLALL
jgi:prepilin signal peptidase PulO-like enzyme (type II secretory pathway)